MSLTQNKDGNNPAGVVQERYAEREISPVLTWDDFSEYIERNREKISQMTGDCNACPFSDACLFVPKNFYLHEFANHVPTKIPHLKPILMRIPFILRILVKRFEKTWTQRTLPCFYNGNAILSEWEMVHEAYRLLSDERSKRTFLQVLMGRITQDVRHFSIASGGEREEHFDALWQKYGEDAVIADCGAYTGDTMEEYIKKYGAPSKYYCYEPDTGTRERLLVTIDKMNAQGFAIVRPVGVYKETTRLHFASGRDSDGRLDQSDGDEIVDVVSLDDDIQDKVTLIKMDIEGAEIPAIEGAKRILEEDAPDLAISVYHFIEDLWRIPLLIHRIAPKYNDFTMRHLEPLLDTETILYVQTRRD